MVLAGFLCVCSLTQLEINIMWVVDLGASSQFHPQFYTELVVNLKGKESQLDQVQVGYLTVPPRPCARTTNGHTNKKAVTDVKVPLMK